MAMQITPHPALYRLDQSRFDQYFIGRSGYFLFKFAPVLEYKEYQQDPQQANVSAEEARMREPQVFILGTQDLHSLFELLPQKGLENGFPSDEAQRQMVAMITHKRSFDNNQGGDQQPLEQCILTVK
mmetsp:Transcript_33309/g.51060  ORF Transcript_33309/g.51060 Transcript_33309/m.51060 type:complete len:127 (+) Transcript_33309:194-574(+)|eukprot:CAMPEP_0170508526 /NCGR_PEP_ID=MMETSP0208-20121228/62617_1 /TAXON_ID=197538 /ORGANISM="Strombidium inclinatum, Strain S3" /LENGTH=126 /DNA_ID=CAMNT_0010791479 /DNA_START=91 /DNA_END=471 /DNA_ORIENTATION=-